LIFDDRSQYLIRKLLIELILHHLEGRDPNPDRVENILEETRELSREMEERLISELVKYKEATPILDFEF
jgi:hypothetical protein